MHYLTKDIEIKSAGVACEDFDYFYCNKDYSLTVTTTIQYSADIQLSMPSHLLYDIHLK